MIGICLGRFKAQPLAVTRWLEVLVNRNSRIEEPGRRKKKAALVPIVNERRSNIIKEREA